MSIDLPYKPGIFKQGLALVLIPLSLGTCVLIFLNYIWSSADQLALEERRQSQIVDQFNEIFKSWGVISGATLNEAVGKDKLSVDTRRNPWLWWRFRSLKELTKSQPERYAKVQRLEEVFVSEVEAFARLPKGDGGLTLALATELPKTLGKIYQLRTEVRRILTSEMVELQTARDKQMKSFEAMKVYAYGFTAINIVLAFILVWLFSKSIGNRLKVLAANAGALARNQTPHSNLHGDDELAYLDKVLAQAGSDLREASNHRRSILGMVAHDMRSPLMSSQVNIQMVEEIGGDYPDGAYESLEAAESQLSSILDFVKQLLTVQKESDSIISSDQNSMSKRMASKHTTINTTNPVDSEQLAYSSDFDFIDTPQNYESNKSLDFQGDSFLRPRIFHKGLFITMVPLLLQMGFLLFINHQLLITQNLAKGEQRCTDINIATNIINMDMVRGATAQGIYLLTSSRTAQNSAEKIFAEIDREYKKLAGVVGEDQDWLHYIDIAKTNAQHQINKIIQLSPSSEPAEKYEAFAEISELKAKSPEAFLVRKTCTELLNKNASELQDMENRQLNLADAIGKIIGFGIFANFLVALFMLYFFSKNITARLNVLVKNAQRLGKGGELQKIQFGTDEIAYFGLILHEARKQLDAASHQRAIMMASLAKQMRIPLQGAKINLDNFASLAEACLKDNPRKHLLRSQNNIERVLRLVDDLLSMETLGSEKLALDIAICNSQSIVEDAISTVASLAKKKDITLINSCAPISLCGDEAKLVQVLMNYLSNAIKFSGQNTTITVSSVVNSESIRIAVSDQGPGMDRETRDRVFEKFFQANTKEKQQGFGLGLAICQLIVQSHGGHLGVDSELGKGSTFWFEIPKQDRKNFIQ